MLVTFGLNDHCETEVVAVTPCLPANIFLC